MAIWQKPETFALWLTIVLLLVIVLVSAFVFFTRLYFKRILREQQKLQDTIIAHQQQLLEDSILVQERERTRIAADLHDDLISKLNVSLLTLNTTQNIPQTSAMLQNSIALARRISHDLSPPLLDDSSLMELIEDFLSPIQQTHQIDIWKRPTTHPLPSDIKLQIFRIVQEVINNIIKHAAAKTIRVQLRSTAHGIALQIQDDGVGFDTEQYKKGLGLKNIVLRSQMLKGDFRFKSTPNKGTTFLFYLPTTKTA